MVEMLRGFVRANHISDHQLGVLTDLEKALGMFSEPDKYSAGLAFFRALGYPMKFERTAVNESMFQFAYLTAKNHCVFSSDEMDAMRDVLVSHKRYFFQRRDCQFTWKPDFIKAVSIERFQGVESCLFD
jgi:hypothetical protein